MTLATRSWLIVLLLSVSSGIVSANVRLPNLISSNMVLQRDMEDPIWGWADPGEKVTVTMNEKTATAVAGADGKWALKIGPFPAGGPFEMQVQGKNTVTVKNILVGEVWMCAGQSNLTFTLGSATDSKKAIDGAEFPQIRTLAVNPDVGSKPVEDAPGVRWTECSPKSIGGFSAVGYFFGRDLHKALGVPVGLIQTGVNDTRAEYYMSRQTLESDPDFQVVLDRWDRWKKSTKVDVDFPNIDEDFGKVYHERDDKVRKYLIEKAAAQKAGKEVGPDPDWVTAWGAGGQWRMVKNFPTGQYYAVICPIIPFGMRGVMWYQGEGNVGNPALYPKLMAALIKSWRKDWAQGDFPFIFVQLPRAEEKTSSYVGLREAQLKVLRAVPNTGMAVTCDILFDADQKDKVHSPQKEPVGQRLALIALHDVYHKDVACYGPLYKEAVKEGGTMRIKFDHVEGGLSPAGGGELKGFEIAGRDHVFHPAKATADKGALIVSSGDVPAPESVRYSWKNEPDGNLTNGSGLPASPFRTDDWSPAPPIAK